MEAQEKHRRSEILIRDVEQLNQKYNKYFIGKEVTVLLKKFRKLTEYPILPGIMSVMCGLASLLKRQNMKKIRW